MKIVTYNVNGIRSAIGKGLCDWIADERPDVLCLQETKAQPEQIPSEAFERMGYRCPVSYTHLTLPTIYSV